MGLSLSKQAVKHPDSVHDFAGVNGVLICVLRAAARVSCCYRPAQGLDAISLYQSTGCALVTASQHSLSQDTRHRPGYIAHCFQLRSGNLVVVAQSDAVFSKYRADRFNITGLPCIQHSEKTLLSFENVLKPAA